MSCKAIVIIKVQLKNRLDARREIANLNGCGNFREIVSGLSTCHNCIASHNITSLIDAKCSLSKKRKNN